MSFNGNLYETDEGLELTTKGQIHTHDSSSNTALNVGTDGYILSADSTEATGLKYVANTDAGLTLGTKGDLHTRSSSTNVALGVGANLKSLYANSATTTGLEWNTNARETLTGTGDVLYSSGANTLARLGAGSDGDVLTLASGVPSWATASAGAWTEIVNDTQGGGANEINLTGLSDTGAFIMFQGLYAVGGSDEIRLRFGIGGSVDTGSHYSYEITNNGGASSTPTGVSYITLNNGANSNPTYISGFMNLDCDETGSGIGVRRGYVLSRRPSQQTIVSFQWDDDTSPLTNIRFYTNGGNDITGSTQVWASGDIS